MAIPRVFIIWDSKIGSDPGARAVGPAPNHLDNLRLAFEGRADAGRPAPAGYSTGLAWITMRQAVNSLMRLTWLGRRQ